MKIRRTLPPASVPLPWKCLWHALAGLPGSRRFLQKREDELKDYFNVRYVFMVSSGKAALTLILNALKSISGKNEVVMPAYTCFSVPSAVVNTGLHITLCDIDGSTLDFNYQSLARRINENTLCVIPHHLFGKPAEMDSLLRVCRKRGVFVVEDAAQAMGGTYHGMKIGTIGDVGFFSLGRGKNITCGSGGIIVTNSRQIAESIDRNFTTLEKPGFLESIRDWVGLLLMTIFIRPSLYWLPDGLPFLKLGATFFHKTIPLKRLSGMKAAYLRNWKARLEQSNSIRARCVSYYSEHMQLNPASDATVPYLRFPIILKSAEARDDIFSSARRLGLGAGVVYPTTVNKIEELRPLFNGERYPCAERVAERILTIPTHHLLTNGDKESICALFKTATSPDAGHGSTHTSDDHATSPVNAMQ